jgi:hypothetical protein
MRGGDDIYADSGVHRRQWITRSGRRRSVPKRPHPDAVFGPPHMRRLLVLTGWDGTPVLHLDDAVSAQQACRKPLSASRKE